MIKEELLEWFENNKNDHSVKLAMDTIYHLNNIFKDELTDNYVICSNGGGVYFQIWDDIDEVLFNYYINNPYMYYIKYKGIEYKGQKKLR